MIRPLITALRTLTVIPVPGKDTDVFPRTFGFFPLVGALLAAVQFGVYLVCGLIFPDQPWLVALFMVAAGVGVTGALHLDGLADTVDGFFGGKIPEQRLEIMKDPRQGTFGVAALVFDLFFKTALYVALILNGSVLPILLSVFLARSLQPLFMAISPYARAEGGTARDFCGSPGSLPRALGSLIMGLAGLCWFLPLPYAAIVAGGSALILFGFTFFCRIKINGITGDCIGALNELVELGVLVAVVIMTNHFMEG